MTEHLRILNLNVGKQKQAQWSMLNDGTLSKFAVLAVVEPYLYADPETGDAQCGTHRQWRPLTPTVRREDSYTRYAYRAMLWINAGIQAVRVPVPSYDIAAARIESSGGAVLVVAAYDPDEGDDVAERDSKLHRKLAFIRQALEETQRAKGESVEVILCTDFNRHDSLWGATEDIVRRRRDEGVPIIHLAHECGLQSLAPVGTITWEHHSGRYWSTVDVITASAGLVSRLIRCQIHEHDHGSDHRPIVIEFDGYGTPRQSTRVRLIPEKADWHQIGRDRTQAQGHNSAR